MSQHIPTAAWPGLHPLPPPQRLWRVLSRPGLVCIPCHAAASKLAHGHLATTTRSYRLGSLLGLAWASVHTICKESSLLWDGKVINQPNSQISYSSSKHGSCYTILTQEMEEISLEKVPGSVTRDSNSFRNKTNSTFTIDFAERARSINQCSTWTYLFINNF